MCFHRVAHFPYSDVNQIFLETASKYRSLIYNFKIAYQTILDCKGKITNLSAEGILRQVYGHYMKTP
jgi:hypothetical protein